MVLGRFGQATCWIDSLELIIDKSMWTLIETYERITHKSCEDDKSQYPISFI
jgi:hypothetical protein